MLVRRFSTRALPEGFGESFTRQVRRVRKYEDLHVLYFCHVLVVGLGCLSSLF